MRRTRCRSETNSQKKLPERTAALDAPRSDESHDTDQKLHLRTLMTLTHNLLTCCCCNQFDFYAFLLIF
jgi:hypothetical protein